MSQAPEAAAILLGSFFGQVMVLATTWVLDPITSSLPMYGI